MSKRQILAGAVVALAAGLVGALLMVGSPAGAATTVTSRYSPLGATEGPGSEFAVGAYCCPSTALVVVPGQVITDNDFQWVLLGLPWDNPTVTSVRVCYQIQTSSPGTTFISQTRLTSMTTPNSATVVVDNGTDRTSTTPTCYSVSSTVNPTGKLTLALKVVFGNVNDKIVIGMVSLTGKTA